MSLSQPTFRWAAQVWPIWLPRAVSQAINAPTAASFARNPLPPILFSASLQLQPYSADSTTTDKASTLPSQKSANSGQQIRNVSTSSHRARQITDQHISSLKPPQQVCDLTSSPPPEIWSAPPDVFERPVAVIGAGVIGRRLAMTWASTGRPVNVYDGSQSTLQEATTYIADNLTSYCTEHKTLPGNVRFTTDVTDAVSNAWMAIEAIPEDLELKISILNKLDQVTSKDCIIATNSINFTSRELSSDVSRRHRLLNTLYYIPPENRCVELMSCGYTSPEIFTFLSQQMKEVHLQPIVIAKEASGMVFPRIWGAIQRETLHMLQRGITPENIDELFRDLFSAKRGPCEKMDEVGLDTVAAVEHCSLSRMGKKGLDRDHLMWLEDEYVKKARLSQKSGEGLTGKMDEKGQVIPHESPTQTTWKEHSTDVSGL